MNNRQLITGQSAKHYKSQFIFKLVDIMKNFQTFANWTHDGTSIQFCHVSQIQRTVLPSYFRHSNFQSFLRQLHLYNFKQNKFHKNRMVFEHPIFRKGNENQFITIQRTKHKKQKQSLLKELQNNDILRQISENITLSENQKQILKTMFSFKLIAIEKQRILKQKLSQFTESLKSNRTKQVRDILFTLEEEIKLELESNKKFSKSIDLFLTGSLNDRTYDQQKKIQQKAAIDSKNKPELKKQDQIKSKCGSLLYEKNSIFEFMKQQERKDEGMVHSNAFYSYQRLFSYPPQEISINDSAPNQAIDQKHHYRSTNNSTDQNQFLINQISQSQNILQSRNTSNIQIELFNFQKEPSIVFMPLPVYNKSVMSEFFDRPNTGFSCEFGMNQKPQEKSGTPEYKQKSEQFQTSGQAGRISNQNGNNMKVVEGQQDSQISFMNEN